MLANDGWNLIRALPMLANGGWDLIRAPTNASKWRMGFNSAFKGLRESLAWNFMSGVWQKFFQDRDV